MISGFAAAGKLVPRGGGSSQGYPTRRSTVMGEPTKNATASSAPAVDPLLGRVINGRFRVLSVIARGGMGKVYRAEQAPLGRVVALKVLNPNYSGENDPEFHKRFLLEASIVARLSHTNTVTLYDYGQSDDGVYFMAMEYLEGRTLHRMLRDEAPLDHARALHIALQVCRSLREAHGHGVIHRDLKPANIFLIRRDDDADFVKVLDFGLVKLTDDGGESLTQTGLFMGSPKYMAPEQIRGERVSAATDVYALGVILFEMLTGRVPFDKPNSVNLLMAHVSEPVPALSEANPGVSVPAAVEELVYRCLSKNPDDRFASMDELIAQIKRVAAGALGVGALLSGTGEFAQLGVQALSSGEQLARASTPPAMPAASDEHAIRAVPPPLPSPLPPPLPVAATSPEAAPRAGRSRAAMVGVALFAVSVLAGFALHALSRPARTASATTPASALPSAPPSAPPGATVRVAIESDPSGAEVYEGETLLGRTPLRETWTGAHGDPAATRILTVRAPGFEVETIRASGAVIAHALRLRPLPSVEPAAPPPPTPALAPERARPRPARPRASPPPSAPEGYRNNVY